MREAENGVFRTRDIAHAAVLKSKNLHLRQTEWVDGVAWWTFDDPDGRSERLIQAYINGKMMGNIKKFIDAQRTIKHTLHDR